jgi:chitinase
VATRRAVLALLLGLAGAVSASATAKAKTPQPVIIAYVFPQDTVIDPATIAADQLTHINYAFANIKDGRVVEGFARDAENFRVLAELRRRHPHLRVLVSVGGWTWSGAFSDASLTPESRRKLVESAVAFVERHDLDGIDIDWEYPGLPGNGNTHRPEDKQNFTALMADLRRGLDADGRKHHRQRLLTFAAGALSDYIAHTEMDKVQAVVDFVNLMTYDFREAEADPQAGHHANLYPHPADPKQESVDRAVREFLAAGVPARKLVLGVPFYGHAWGNVKPEASGLYQPGGAAGERVDTTYGALVEGAINRNGYVRIWDDKAQAAFLWNAEKRIFVSYEDPESLRLKSRYILDHGLAGVMFWEYYADRTGTLLKTLAAELRPRTTPSR